MSFFLAWGSQLLFWSGSRIRSWTYGREAGPGGSSAGKGGLVFGVGKPNREHALPLGIDCEHEQRQWTYLGDDSVHDGGLNGNGVLNVYIKQEPTECQQCNGTYNEHHRKLEGRNGRKIRNNKFPQTRERRSGYWKKKGWHVTLIILFLFTTDIPLLMLLMRASMTTTLMPYTVENQDIYDH